MQKKKNNSNQKKKTMKATDLKKDLERRSYLVSLKYKNLKKKKIGIVGVGGTGNLICSLLARAGVGKLILIDKDMVEESNLERQIMFDFSDTKKSKSKVCYEKLSKFCNVTFFDNELNENNVESFGLEKCDLIIDCTDNLESRFIINDFCLDKKIPFIYTGAIQNLGIVYFVNSKEASLENKKAKNKKSPCLRCFLYNKIGKKAKEVGVINACVTTVSSIAASMAYNYLVFGKIEENMIRINLFTMEFDKIKIKPNSECRCQIKH
jgi:molybdopterin-synthase adenylyltransferase